MNRDFLVELVELVENGAGANHTAKRFFFVMGCLGIEPRTYRLKVEYSTIELATLMIF